MRVRQGFDRLACSHFHMAVHRGYKHASCAVWHCTQLCKLGTSCAHYAVSAPPCIVWKGRSL